MFYGLWTDKTMLSLQKGLDAAAERHRVTANNVANVNTPNFKRSTVSFEGDLQRALAQEGKGMPLRTTHSRHLGGASRLDDVRHSIVEDRQTSMRTDGNNVDIDREMAMMAANQLNYNALTQLVNERYGVLRYVIHEGRR